MQGGNEITLPAIVFEFFVVQFKLNSIYPATNELVERTLTIW